MEDKNGQRIQFLGNVASTSRSGAVAQESSIGIAGRGLKLDLHHQRRTSLKLLLPFFLLGAPQVSSRMRNSN